ncbi:MAG: calcium-binding protein [Paracoccaceae bacterium]
MLLQSAGIMRAGSDALDNGITALEAARIGGVLSLYAGSGAYGGIVQYSVQAAPVVVSSVVFPPNLTAVAADRLVLAAGGVPTLFHGGDGAGLQGYVLDPSGRIGAATTVSLSDAAARAAEGGFALAEALLTFADTAAALFPQGTAPAIADLKPLDLQGATAVLTANPMDDTVRAYRSHNGALVEFGRMGAAQGLGLAAPSAIEVVTLGGVSYVLVAGTGSDSVSVMRVDPVAGLVPVEHRIDNGFSRFASVQALGVAAQGDHAFVVAGGADHGLTVWRLLPDGRLVPVQTLADDATTSLHTVTAIEAVIDVGVLHVFASAQGEGGVSHFTMALDTLGSVLTGTEGPELMQGGADDDVLVAQGDLDTLIGGAGDDVLVSDGAGIVLTGGAGADLFVMDAASGVTRITDFERGLDRIDMTRLPMLRDLGALNVVSTASGATIDYRAQTIVVQAADNAPLTLADLVPQGLAGGDVVPFVPIRPTAPPGVRLTGTAARDTLIGTPDSDTLEGGDMDDTLDGGAGDDVLIGGSGRDLLTALSGYNQFFGDLGADRLEGGGEGDYLSGGEGADTIKGWDGDDTILSGGGRDHIVAGNGNDLVMLDRGRNRAFMGEGDDTVAGGTGKDRLAGAAGNDVLDGGAGNDLIGGGIGDDILRGGDGNDRLFGKKGHDLLEGGEGHDGLWGYDDDDTLRGGGGNDFLVGGNGNDAIHGGDGVDTLRGAPGNDTLWGDEGADVFEFFSDHEQNTIMDFDAASGDTIGVQQAMWWWRGSLSAAQVVQEYGHVGAEGVVLDFSGLGGCQIVVIDEFDPGAVAAALHFF